MTRFSNMLARVTREINTNKLSTPYFTGNKHPLLITFLGICWSAVFVGYSSYNYSGVLLNQLPARAFQ